MIDYSMIENSGLTVMCPHCRTWNVITATQETLVEMSATAKAGVDATGMELLHACECKAVLRVTVETKAHYDPRNK